MQEQTTPRLLREMHQELRASMAILVKAELDWTIARWQAAGRPAGKQPRPSLSDSQTEWTRFGADLVLGGEPWEAAVAESLYQLSLDMALQAEADHPGLELDKDLNYWFLGMAQYYQGRVEEGIHSMLCAVAESRAAGRADRFNVSQWALDRLILQEIRDHLAPAVVLCARGGLSAITDAHLVTMTEDMCRDEAGAYDPQWALRLHASLLKLHANQPGHSSQALARRFEGLQGLSFVYEGALREHHLAPGALTLKPVVSKVCDERPLVPRVVLCRWKEFTSFGGSTLTHCTADRTLAALKTEAFAGLSAPEVFAARAVLTTGLVRNTVHHKMDLKSTMLNADYQWVCDQMLAALVLSW